MFMSYKIAKYTTEPSPSQQITLRTHINRKDHTTQWTGTDTHVNHEAISMITDTTGN